MYLGLVFLLLVGICFKAVKMGVVPVSQVSNEAMNLNASYVFSGYNETLTAPYMTVYLPNHDKLEIRMNFYVHKNSELLNIKGVLGNLNQTETDSKAEETNNTNSTVTPPITTTTTTTATTTTTPTPKTPPTATSELYITSTSTSTPPPTTAAAATTTTTTTTTAATTTTTTTAATTTTTATPPIITDDYEDLSSSGISPADHAPPIATPTRTDVPSKFSFDDDKKIGLLRLKNNRIDQPTQLLSSNIFAPHLSHSSNFSFNTNDVNQILKSNINVPSSSSNENNNSQNSAENELGHYLKSVREKKQKNRLVDEDDDDDDVDLDNDDFDKNGKPAKAYFENPSSSSSSSDHMNSHDIELWNYLYKQRQWQRNQKNKKINNKKIKSMK